MVASTWITDPEWADAGYQRGVKGASGGEPFPGRPRWGVGFLTEKMGEVIAWDQLELGLMISSTTRFSSAGTLGNASEAGGRVRRKGG